MPSEHRLHPSSILFALAGSLKAFALPALLLLITSGRSSPEPAGPPGWGPAGWMNRWMPGDFEIANWQFWLLLFLIPATIVAITNYFSFRVRYEGTELVIKSGIFFRNERHVPYARIQNLDAVRNVMHRLLGVTEVRVETGGGDAPEATISVLHESVFEEMRRRIFAGRAAADGKAEPGVEASAAAETSAIQPRTLLHLPLRELFLHGVLENRGMLVIAAGYGLLWEAGLFRAAWDRVANGWYGPGLVRDTFRRIAAGEPPPFGQIAVLLVGIVGLLILVRVLSMIWSGLRLYEFRLSRIGEDLRTEYGLLTRVTATVPLRRVQTVTIREAPLQRLVNRQSVRVETAGGQEKSEDGPKRPREWLAPIVRGSAVPALVREVLPGFELAALDWRPLHARAFRRAVKPALCFGAFITLPILFTLGWRAAFLVLPFTLAWMTLVAWQQIRRTQWAVTEDAVAFRSGWLWRSLTIAPVVKIQTVECFESPFDRRAAMARVRVDTAGAGERSHRVAIPYLSHATARDLYHWLSAQAAHTTFRW